MTASVVILHFSPATLSDRWYLLELHLNFDLRLGCCWTLPLDTPHLILSSTVAVVGTNVYFVVAAPCLMHTPVHLPFGHVCAFVATSLTFAGHVSYKRPLSFSQASF